MLLNLIKELFLLVIGYPTYARRFPSTVMQIGLFIIIFNENDNGSHQLKKKKIHLQISTTTGNSYPLCFMGYKNSRLSYNAKTKRDK